MPVSRSDDDAPDFEKINHKPRRSNITCHKTRYYHKEDAMAALSNVRSYASARHIENRYYFCKWCRAWHLTSQPKIGRKV